MSLLKLLREASKKGDYTLASGKKSDWYLDCREVTTTHRGLQLIVNEILALRREYDFNVLGGPASAAIPLMAGLVTMLPIVRSFVYTREKTKEHGMEQQVDGVLLGDKLLLVDDVLTSGGSLLRCRDTIMAKYPDLEIIGAWVLVDRAEGGSDMLLREGIEVFSSFTKLDICG